MTSIACSVPIFRPVWPRWCVCSNLGDPQRPVRRAADTLHGPLARYVKLRVAHAPGMPGTFSPPSRVSDPDMHHGTCATHVPWCMPGSLISGFLWSQWRGKRSRHSRRMRNPQFYVSGKRPIPSYLPPDLTNCLLYMYILLSKLLSTVMMLLSIQQHLIITKQNYQSNNKYVLMIW